MNIDVFPFTHDDRNIKNYCTNIDIPNQAYLHISKIKDITSYVIATLISVTDLLCSLDSEEDNIFFVDYKDIGINSSHHKIVIKSLILNI